jgi:hypothetical protein
MLPYLLRNGCEVSTGVTYFVCCLRTAKNARCRLPQLYSGVYCFFDEVEKTINPTRMGIVREPGSLTHPQVTPIEGFGAVPQWEISVSLMRMGEPRRCPQKLPSRHAL